MSAHDDSDSVFLMAILGLNQMKEALGLTRSFNFEEPCPGVYFREAGIGILPEGEAKGP